jgi:hypothetical protein
MSTCRFLFQSEIFVLQIKALNQMLIIQGDQNVSVHLMIKIPKVTSNVQSVPRQSPDIY